MCVAYYFILAQSFLLLLRGEAVADSDAAPAVVVTGVVECSDSQAPPAVQEHAAKSAAVVAPPALLPPQVAGDFHRAASRDISSDVMQYKVSSH